MISDGLAKEIYDLHSSNPETLDDSKWYTSDELVSLISDIIRHKWTKRCLTGLISCFTYLLFISTQRCFSLNSKLFITAQDLGNGVLESSLCMQRTVVETTRIYTIVAENSVGQVFKNVQLFMGKRKRRQYFTERSVD